MFKCELCNMEFDNEKKYKRHLKSFKHKNNIKLNEKDSLINDLTVNNQEIKEKNNLLETEISQKKEVIHNLENKINMQFEEICNQKNRIEELNLKIKELDITKKQQNNSLVEKQKKK